MITSDQVNSVQELLSQAQSILIIVAAQPEVDVLAASGALFLTLQQAGKEVVFASPEVPTLAEVELAGVEQLKTQINNQNLVVSFAYQETAVEKVSYHIGEETQRFYLTIAPQKGQLPLNKETVELGYAGAAADLVFLFGIHDYEQLEHLYIGNEQLFLETTVVSLHNFATELGSIKLDIENELNLSSAVAGLIKNWGLELPAEAATNLLFSLEAATAHFSSLATTAETLETAAWLMRAGARRLKPASPSSSPSSQVQLKASPQISVQNLAQSAPAHQSSPVSNQAEATQATPFQSAPLVSTKLSQSSLQKSLAKKVNQVNKNNSQAMSSPPAPASSAAISTNSALPSTASELDHSAPTSKPATGDLNHQPGLLGKSS